MGKDTCYVIAREGVSGGTGSLSYRLLSYLHGQGHQCAYLCCENNSPQTFILIEKVTDTIEIDIDKSYRTQFERLRKKYDSFVFLTYSVDEYLAIEKLRKQYGSIKRSFLYVVHLLAFSVSYNNDYSHFKKKLSQIYVRLKYRHLVKKLILNKSIIFMDDDAVKETKRSLKIDMKGAKIYYLPIVVNQYSPEEWNTLHKHDPFTICTMCRMDFPFKGYVFGLIDTFVKLQERNDLKLIIVGTGAQASELNHRLSTLPKQIRQKVEYIESIPYSQIHSFYKETDLAIGMGTMVLDAANNGVLAIAVKPYTYELNISSLFLDDVTHVVMNGEKVDSEKFILRLIALPDEKYRELILKQYDRFNATYNIQIFSKMFVSSEIGTCPVGNTDVLMYNMIKKIR